MLPESAPACQFRRDFRFGGARRDPGLTPGAFSATLGRWSKPMED
jgi:hypothetical protein